MAVFPKRTRCRYDGNWHLISSARRSGQLIKRLDLRLRFGFDIETIDWQDYWQNAIESVRSSEFCTKLESLRLARTAYFANPRNENCAKDYCRNYFEFLHDAVHSEDLGQHQWKVLRCLVGLETIPVYWQKTSCPDLIAVNTKTNPVYLLSRIHQPKSWDNIRFLPMVGYGSFGQDNEQKNPLYHQYRRITGGRSESTTLLTYIPVAIEDRKNSFIAWQHLAASLTRKKDTLIGTRSQCLSEQVAQPIIQKLPGFEQSPEKVLRIADLGGGSGDLTKAIIENVLSSNSATTDSIRIALTIVDFDFPDMRRHLKKTAFFRSLISLKCHRKDFLDWTLEKSSPSDKTEIEVKVKMSEQQASKPFDLIFLFRLLNNMSDFGIEKATTLDDVRTVTDGKLSEQDWRDGKYYPHRAIAMNQLQKIVLSTTQVTLNSQTTWCVASLSDYFQALSYLSREETEIHRPENKPHNSIFFPVRKLDLDKIRYKQGRNFFEDLCRLCHFVLVEDIDLRSDDLRHYLHLHGLLHLKVIDLPSRIPLSNTFCICEEGTFR